jgi:hypothetical protein
MCLACRERLDAGVRERRVARIVRGAGYAAGFTGVVGLPVAAIFPLGAFFMSVPAMLGGWRTLTMIRRLPAARELLGWHHGPVMLGAIVGLLLGGLGVAAMALHFVVLFRNAAS